MKLSRQGNYKKCAEFDVTDFRTYREQLLQSQRQLKTHERQSDGLNQQLIDLNRRVEHLNEERDDSTGRVCALEDTIARSREEAEVLRSQLAGQLGEDSQLMGEFTK